MFIDMKFKDDVRIKKLNWQLVWIFEAVYISYYKVIGIGSVCTSVNDGVHMKNSYHYQDLAADFSIRDMTKVDCRKVVKEIKKLLGGAYDVVLEDDHIHVEFDLRKYNLD